MLRKGVSILLVVAQLLVQGVAVVHAHGHSPNEELAAPHSHEHHSDAPHVHLGHFGLPHDHEPSGDEDPQPASIPADHDHDVVFIPHAALSAVKASVIEAQPDSKLLVSLPVLPSFAAASLVVLSPGICTSGPPQGDTARSLPLFLALQRLLV